VAKQYFPPVKMPKPPKLPAITLASPRRPSLDEIMPPPEPPPPPNSTPAYLYPLKALQYIDESIWNVVAKVYEKLGVVEDVGTPYEEVRDTVRSALVGYGGLDPEGAAVRWGGRIGGFIGSMPVSLLAWLAAPATKAFFKPGAGTVGKILSAPFRTMTWPMSLVKVGITMPAEQIARGISALGWLAKEHSVAQMMGAPFKALASAIQKSAEGTGLGSGTARALIRSANAIRDAFGAGGWWAKLVRPLGIRATAEATSWSKFDEFGKAWTAGDFGAAAKNLEITANAYPVKTMARTLATGERVVESAGLLSRVLKHLGPQGTMNALREIHSVSAGAPDDMLMRLAETRGAAAVARALPLSKPSRTLLMSIIRHNRFLLENSTDTGLLARQILWARTYAPPEIREPLLEILSRRTTPLSMRELYRLSPVTSAELKKAFPLFAEQADWLDEAQRLGLREAVVPRGKLKGFTFALKSPRIAYATRFGEEAAISYMNQHGLWPKMTANAIATLRRTEGMSPAKINKLIAEATSVETSAKTVMSPKHRLNLFRHLTADELNKAAWDAGLPDTMKLFRTGLIESSSLRGVRLVKQNMMLRTRLAALEAARADTATATLPQKLGLKWSANKAVSTYSEPAYKGMEWVLRRGVRDLRGYDLLRDAATGEWIPIDEGLGRAVRGAYQLFSKQQPVETISRLLLRLYDRFLGINKHLSLNYSFGYMVRNWIDDVVRMMVGNGVAATADGLMDAYRMGRGRTVTLKFADGTTVPMTESLATRYVLQSGKQAEAVVEAGVLPELSVSMNEFMKKAHKYSLMQINSFMENFRARAQLMASLRLNRNKPFSEALEAALKDVREILYSYSDITPFEAAVPARVIFFYRFARRNIPFHVKMLFAKPFSQYMALVGPRRLFGEDERPEDVYMPRWIRERGGFPIWRSGSQVEYSPGLGLSVFDAFAKILPGSLAREWLGAIAPGIRIPLEAVSGKRFFIDRDIEDINRIYSPTAAAVLRLANPIWKALFDRKLVRTVEHGGKEYYVVPGELLWVVGMVRPLNDLLKLADPRRDVGDRLRWALTGTQSYIYDIEQLKTTGLLRQIREGVRELERQGLLRHIEIPYISKDIEMTPEESARALRYIRLLRQTSKRSR